MQRQTPLLYLHGIIQGLYEPAWPVFIVEDRPQALTTSSPIATSWQSAMPSSATRAERLYPSGHVDTKYPGA